ncbi:MAG TPA: hypothetical protein VHV83_18385, partial [Armatimonadota bacterium]|nr:hypothetical protein [Armatimonadota bacterium]
QCRLCVMLDGKILREIPISAVPPTDTNVKPEYERTEFKPEWNIYQAAFNKDYVLDIPAGQHTIMLDNIEGDWIKIDRITLTNYSSDRYPMINVFGRTTGRFAFLWLHNAQNNWQNVNEKREISPVVHPAVMMHGLQDGTYTVSWWNTENGTVFQRQIVRVRHGAVQLSLPKLATDVAAQISPVANRSHTSH